MTRSGWRYILAAVGLAIGYPLAESANGQASATHNQAEDAVDASSRATISIENSLARIANASEAELHSPEGKAEVQRARDDLRAQQEMADWAWGAMLAAVSTVILSAAGVFLIWRTLTHTRRAADYAGEMADEGRRATAATAKILETERKPFLTLQPINAEKIRWDRTRGIIGVLDSDGTVEPAAVLCSVKSAGRSPAILTAISRRWTKGSIKETPEVIMPKSDEDFKYRKEFSIPVGPDGIIIASDAERSLPGDSGERVYFLGYLEFTDLNGEDTYISGFCYSFDERRPLRGLVTGLFPGRDEKYWYYREVPPP